MRDARSYLNLIALINSLGSSISKYQFWEKKTKSCTFERFFEKQNIYRKLKILERTPSITDDKLKFVQNLDCNTKKFLKAGQTILYCPSSLQEAKQKIIIAPK